MRWIGFIIILPLIACLSAESPAGATSFEGFFFHILGEDPSQGLENNPGTMSYAGGSAPLIGSNIAVNAIVQTPAPIGQTELRCVGCILGFSTGPFAGTTDFGSGPHQDYLFSAGGSFQIIGGVSTFDGTPVLPLGTTLLTGVMTSFFQPPSFTDPFVADDFGPCGLGPCSELEFLFDQGAVNPTLGTIYGLPAGVASVSGNAIISTLGLNNAPDPFVQSTFTGTHQFEPSFVRVGAPSAVPEPDMLWLTVIGFAGLAGWGAWRKAFPL